MMDNQHLRLQDKTPNTNVLWIDTRRPKDAGTHGLTYGKKSTIMYFPTGSLSTKSFLDKEEQKISTMKQPWWACLSSPLGSSLASFLPTAGLLSLPPDLSFPKKR